MFLRLEWTYIKAKPMALPIKMLKKYCNSHTEQIELSHKIMRYHSSTIVCQS